MTPCQRKSMAHMAVTQAMMEMAVADPSMAVVEAASQIAREAALHLLAIQGPAKASEAMYRLADELVGAR